MDGSAACPSDEPSEPSTPEPVDVSGPCRPGRIRFCMTFLLLVSAALAGVGVGWALRRRGGWSPGVHRMALTVLMIPWLVQHLSLARLARSPSLNPIRRTVGGVDLALADLMAPVLVAAALAVCFVWTRRLRLASAALPLLAELLLWWVTVPLYQRVTLRGWFFVTEGLSGPWPLAYQVAAAGFLAGFAGPAGGSDAAEPGLPPPPPTR